jgi:hypothetical protein
MLKPTVVFSNDNKSATVIAANGARVQVVAQDTLSVWFRKDGGVTLRTDSEHRAQTVRVDAYGRLTNSRSIA